MRSASVDFPWSMCAMVQMFRTILGSLIGVSRWVAHGVKVNGRLAGIRGRLLGSHAEITNGHQEAAPDRTAPPAPQGGQERAEDARAERPDGVRTGRRKGEPEGALEAARPGRGERDDPPEQGRT